MKRNYNFLMKSYLIVLVGLFVLATHSPLNAQVSKKPLFELFTSSTCGPCAAQNPMIDAILDDNEGTYSLIKYQMDWPGDGDPYYTEQGGVRRNYYSVTGVPDLQTNGYNFGLPGLFEQADLDLLLSETTNLEIDVNASIDENWILTLEAVLNPLDNYDAGLIAHIVIVEKLTTENVNSNGELEFRHVMMTMLPGATGTELDALVSGTPVTLSESYDMNNTFTEQPNDLLAIVFVQNNTNKEVIQSETAMVDHPFNDYSVTFNITTTEGDLVEDAEIFMEGYGTKHSDVNGLADYDGVIPGTYSYDVLKAGLYPTSGTFEVTDDDVEVSVILEIPDYYFFEDWVDGIPETWTIYATSPDFLYAYDGKAIFFKQSSGDDPIVLISPEIDLTNADMLTFTAGEAQGAPKLLIGTVSAPDDMESFEQMLEINPGSPMEEYSIDLAAYMGTNSYLMFKFDGAPMEYFSMGPIKITESFTQTYNVAFQVNDEFSNALEDATVNFNNQDLNTDEEGFVEFENIEEGEYDYIVNYEEFEVVSGSLFVDGNEFVFIEITVTNISEIDDSEIELYPIPAKNEISIKSAFATEVLLIGLDGKQLLHQEINQEISKLNVSEIQNGLYILKIIQDNKVYNRKILITK